MKPRSKRPVRAMPEGVTGVLPARAPLANPYVPFQDPDPPKYEARKALIRGTMFPGLDLPFLGMVNDQLKPDTLLNQLRTVNFAVQELMDMVAKGELGEVYQVYVSFRSHRSIPGLGGAFTTKSIAGGGVLIDWGVHFLDIVMYCCGDPKPLTATAETFSKLGKDIPNYAYVGMWAGPPVLDGTYDVEEGITGMVRTDGPIITLNGAWAQNIEVPEMYIDFIGDKGGIRLQYGADFTLYSTKNGMLTATRTNYQTNDHFENEINAFVDCVKTGEKLPSHIDTNILTSKLMQALYDSADLHREVVIE